MSQQQRLSRADDTASESDAAKVRQLFDWGWIAHLGIVTALLSFIGLVSGRLYTWAYLEEAGAPTQLFSYSSQDLMFFGYLSQMGNLLIALLVVAGFLAMYAALFALLEWLAPWVAFLVFRRWGRAAWKCFISSSLARLTHMYGAGGRVSAWATRNRAEVEEMRGSKRRTTPPWLWFLIASLATVLVLFVAVLPCAILVRVSMDEGRKQFEDEVTAFRLGSEADQKRLKLRYMVIEREHAGQVRVITGFVVQATPSLVALHDGRALETVPMDPAIRCQRIYDAWARPDLTKAKDCGATARS
ncbi:hypothetical protein GEOBC_01413 [Geobacteraceae bacterium]|nr:hypothetical protein GEOBC_01413 [Geobacteraceae bacterium]